MRLFKIDLGKIFRSLFFLNRFGLTNLAFLLISIVIITGIFVLVGWQFNNNSLKRVLPDLVAMNPLTAFSFVMIGISFLLIFLKRKNHLLLHTAKSLLWFTILLSGLKLAGLLFNSGFQIDHILFSEKISIDASKGLTSHMAVNTALAFILSGISLLLIALGPQSRWMLSHVFALAVFAFGFFSLLGYLYGAPEFYDLLKHLPMAFHTSACFMLISLAVLLINPEAGITKEFSRNVAGRYASRAMIFIALVIPVVLGFVRLYTLRTDIFSPELGTTSLILSIVVIFCGFVVYYTIALNRKNFLQVKTEKKFRSLLESAPDAMVIVDDKGIIQIVNEQSEKIFGFSRDEMIGEKVEMLIPQRYQAKHSGYRDDYFGNPKVRSMGMGLALFGRKKNGREFSVEVSLSPLETEEGPLVSAAVRDVTERKKAEEKIRQSEELFRSLVTSVRDYAIFMLDVDGHIVTWNKGAEAIKGYKEKEIKGKHISVFYTQEDVEQNMSGRALNIAKEKGRVELEGWRVRKDGSVFWADVVITALYNQSGILTGFAKVTRDSTERKKARETLAEFNEQLNKQVNEKTKKLEETTAQLRQLSAHLQTAREEERRKIAREMHDELGQMLVGLRMDIVWLRKKISSEDEAIIARFERALELLSDTRQTMRRISTDLHPALLEHMGLSAALALQAKEFEKRSGIKTSFMSKLESFNDLDLSDDVAIGFYRIFQESLTNIAKHAFAREVNSHLQKENDSLKLTIADDGRGFNIDEAQNNKTLGLISMRERALMMDGDYQILSTPGKGTSILLTVPLKLK